MNHGLRRLEEDFPPSLRLIREVQKIYCLKGEGARNTQANSAEVKIGSVARGRAMRCAPPPPERVMECMGALEKFLHLENEDLPILVKAALVRSRPPTVAKALQHIVELGLVRETTGKQRHRPFTYHRYLNILNRGTELPKPSPLTRGT